MTDEQYRIAQALGQVSALPGSWDKRFTRDVARMPIERALTASQSEWLAYLAWKYRRQMPFAVPQAVSPRIKAQDAEKLQRWNEGKAKS